MKTLIIKPVYINYFLKIKLLTLKSIIDIVYELPFFVLPSKIYF